MTTLVGQAPNSCNDPTRPLAGRAASFLGSLVGLSGPSFRRRFRCRNLLGYFPGKAGKGDRFPVREARAAARAVRGRRLILLGRGVAAAFGLPRDAPLCVWIWHANRLVAVVPHPSGVNCWWNDAGNRERAAAFLQLDVLA